MKTIVIAILFFLLGGAAFYGYTRYQNLQNENVNLKKQLDTTQGATPTQGEMQANNNNPSPTMAVAKGKITGIVGYPAEGIPPLSVYAFDKNDKSKYFMVQTKEKATTFTIEDVDPGTYYVVAYAPYSTLSGAYTKAVPCGLSVDCKDHGFIYVDVKAGETTSGVEVRDYYAPEGTFPKKP